MKHPIRILLVVLVAALTAGACGGDGQSNDAPPWGLDGVDMPNTEEEIAAVFAALPDEIAGLPRIGVRPPGSQPVMGLIYAGGGITAGGWDEVRGMNEPGIETPAGYFLYLASEGEEGFGTVVASATDPGGDLLWMTVSIGQEGIPEDATGAEPFYWVSWAKPDGSWFFEITIETEAVARQLVETFVTAAGG